MKRSYKLKTKRGTLGKTGPRFDLKPETRRGIWAVGFFTVTIILVLSLFNLGGIVGKYLVKVFSLSFGWGIFFIPFIFLTAGIILLKAPGLKLSYKGRLIGVGLFTFTILGLLHVFTDISNSLALAKIGKGGGYLGFAVSYPLLKIFSFWGNHDCNSFHYTCSRQDFLTK